MRGSGRRRSSKEGARGVPAVGGARGGAGKGVGAMAEAGEGRTQGAAAGAEGRGGARRGEEEQRWAARRGGEGWRWLARRGKRSGEGGGRRDEQKLRKLLSPCFSSLGKNELLGLLAGGRSNPVWGSF